jgi:hypothetical protein
MEIGLCPTGMPLKTGLGLRTFSHFFLSQREQISNLSEKGPDGLLGVGNDSVILLLIKYLFHAAAVDFHFLPFPREKAVFLGRFRGFR